jgi:hypothetical protein
VLFRKKLNAQRVADALGDRGLDLDEVAQRLVVALRPELDAVRGVHQLGGRAHAVTAAADAALQDVADAELRADRPDILARVLVLHGRGAGDDRETIRMEPAQMGDQLLGEAVAEVVLFRAAAQVLERQDRQRDPAFPRGGGRRLAGDAVAARFTPGVELGADRVDAPELAGGDPMHRQAFVLLPALHRADAAVQVRSNLPPGVQVVVGARGRTGRRGTVVTHRHQTDEIDRDMSRS